MKEIFEGDASKIERVLGWKPKTTFYELVQIMVDSEMEKMEKCGNGKRKL